MANFFEKQLRKKTRWIVWIKALRGALFALILTGVAFYGLLLFSYFFPNLYWGKILTSQSLFWIFLAPCTFVFLGILFTQQMDIRKLCESLETEYPQLKDRLRTAAEFSNQKSVSQNVYSQAFVKGLEAEISELISRFHFMKAMKLPSLWLPVKIMALIGLVVLAQHLLKPSLLKTAYQRMTQPEITAAQIPVSGVFLPRPKVFPDFEIKVSPGDCEIPKKSNLLVQVQIIGYQPKKVEIHIRQRHEHSWRILPMKKIKDGQYQYTMNHITEQSTYYVKADHKKTASFKIKIYESLKLDRVVWKLEFPAYMKMPAQVRQGWRDKMTVPAGTKMEVVFSSNQPVKTGFIEMKNKERLELKSSADNPKDLAGSFTAQRDEVLRLEIKSTHGESVSGISPLWLQVIEDQRPYLEIAEPQPKNYVFPSEEIPFEIHIDDDFGIESVHLVLEYKGNQKKIDWTPKIESKTELVMSPVLSLESLGLEGGDLVFAYLEIKDNFPGNPQHLIKSPVVVFLIRDYVEQYKVLGEQNDLPSLRKVFDAILADQEEMIKDTWDFISAQSEGALNPS